MWSLFTNTMWFIGMVESLDKSRRSFQGTALMGLFISSEAENEETITYVKEQISSLNNIAQHLIDILPFPLNFVATPFQDYITGTN